MKKILKGDIYEPIYEFVEKFQDKTWNASEEDTVQVKVSLNLICIINKYVNVNCLSLFEVMGERFKWQVKKLI